MKTFPLTVFPETDGELCGSACRLMADIEDGSTTWCTAFGEELTLARRDPHPNSPPDRGWTIDRYRRRPECIEAEKKAT